MTDQKIMGDHIALVDGAHGDAIRRPSFEEALPDLSAAIERRCNRWEYVMMAFVDVTEPERCLLEGVIGQWNGFCTAEELRERWAAAQSALNYTPNQWRRVAQQAGAQCRSIGRRAMARVTGKPLFWSRLEYPPRLFPGGIETSICLMQSMPKHPLAGEINRRAKLWGDAESDVEMQRDILEKCKADPLYFIENWVWWTDRRHRPTVVPLQLLPQQRELLKWLQSEDRRTSISLIDGDRISGKTMICEAFGMWRWLFHPGATVFRSKNFHEVMESMSGMLSRLPEWLKPPGSHMSVTGLQNAVTGASIVIDTKGDLRGRKGGYCFFDRARFSSADEFRAAVKSIPEGLIVVESWINDESRPVDRLDFQSPLATMTLHSYRVMQKMVNRSFDWDAFMGVNYHNRRIRIAPGAPGALGAPEVYECHLVDRKGERRLNSELQITFQGAADGYSEEMLVAIATDRLLALQSGPSACPEYAVALTHLDNVIRQLLRARTIQESQERDAKAAQP